MFHRQDWNPRKTYANRHLNRVQVIPLTTNSDRVYPSEALVVVNRKDHKAIAGQIMTISKERV